MKPPHPANWSALFEQALNEPRFRERLTTYATRRCRWVRRYGDVADYASELVQRALERTYEGRRPWDPTRRSLFVHLRGVISSLSNHDYERAKRFAHEALDPRLHAPTDTTIEDDRAWEALDAMRRLAVGDAEVTSLLDAYEEGVVLRRDAIARTGLDQRRYEAARDRIARMRDRLPQRLIGISPNQEFCGANRQTHAGFRARRPR